MLFSQGFIFAQYITTLSGISGNGIIDYPLDTLASLQQPGG